MKKKILWLLLLLLVTTTACSKNSNTTNQDFSSTEASVEVSASGDVSESSDSTGVEAVSEATAISASVEEEKVLPPASSVTLESWVENDKNIFIKVCGYDERANELWQYMPDKIESYYADIIQVEEIGMSSDGYAYLADGIIYCLDLTDGSVKWTNTSFGGYNISAYVDKESNRYFVAGFDGPIIKVFSSEGEVLFEDTYIDKEFYWIHSLDYIPESNEVAVWFDSCDTYVYYSLEDYSRRIEIKEPVITEINRYVLDPEAAVSLSPKDIEYFKKALDAIFAREETLNLGVDYDTYLRIMYAIRSSAYEFLLSEYDTNRNNTALVFKYAFEKSQQEEILQFLDNEYLEMINSSVRPGMNELEKTLAIYKRVVQKIEYDYDWLESFEAADEKFSFPGISIYQALSTGKGVCHSYAYVAQFALLQLGIETTTLSADTTSGGGHMWLAVRYGNNYYHIDPTWDDYGASAHMMYFGMTDEENIQRGIVDNWLVSVNMEYGYFYCMDESFADLRNVTFYSLKGDGNILVYRDYDFVKEPVKLPQVE